MKNQFVQSFLRLEDITIFVWTWKFSGELGFNAVSSFCR